MLTTFGETVDTAAPREEYPRPQLRRDSYLNLNGDWEFVGARRDVVPQRFSARITVPYPPESQLSGIGRPSPKGFALWYRRAFQLPEGFRRERVLLHFDGVDQRATVWCNGQEIGTHTGGYTGFTLDITEQLQEGGNILILRAEDEPGSICAFGSQKRHSSWSGIWQSVWCESVPACRIDSLQIVPHLEDGSIELTVHPARAEDEGLPCRALIAGVSHELTAGVACRLPVGDYLPWTPDHPTLYPLTVTLGEDEVESYYAMREFRLDTESCGLPRFLLNGEPFFVNGVLAQGYWPDGLSAAPTDGALEADVRAARDMGFNTLRLRDKVECPRFYYHCDRLGLMVWQGMPTGGRDRHMTLPVKDFHYTFFGRKDPENRRQHMRELRDMVLLLRNSPSVVLWELFDEGRGQFETENLSRLADELDGTRPIDRSSGGRQEYGVLRSIHRLHSAYSFSPDKKGRAVVLSAFGGYGNVAHGHLWSKNARARVMYDSPQRLAFALESLYEESIRPAAKAGLAGCIYSQLYDVEDDITGLISYDRRICKISPKQLRRIVKTGI